MTTHQINTHYVKTASSFSNKSIQLGKQRVNCEYDLHFLKFWLSNKPIGTYIGVGYLG